MLGLGVLDLIVADAVFAGDEDHAAGRELGHVDRVVPGARHHWHVGVAQLLRSARHGVDAVAVKALRRVAGHQLDLHVQPALLAEPGGKGLDLVGHLVHHGVGAVAQVDRELDPAWNHIAAVRVHLNHADGAAPMRGMAQSSGYHLLHDGRGHLHRILAQCHGCRTGVGFHAGHGAVKPADTQHALHHADGDVVVFQHRALFDVGLEIGANRVLAGFFAADVANSVQLVAHRFAFGVAGGVGMLQGEGLGEHTRAHHHWHKARAFFIGPERHLDRRLGLNPQVVQGAHHLDAGQHAVVAVKLAAGGLGVDVAAGHDGRQAVVAPGPAHEAVADLVDGDAHAGLARPACHQVAALFVQVGQGQAADAALGRGADLGQFHQRGPKALAVDAQAADVNCGGCGHGFSPKRGLRAYRVTAVGFCVCARCCTAPKSGPKAGRLM